MTAVGVVPWLVCAYSLWAVVAAYVGGIIADALLAEYRDGYDRRFAREDTNP